MEQPEKPNPWVQLEESDPWVNLQGPESDPGRRFLGFSCPAAIILNDSHILPPIFGKTQEGSHLSFGIFGGDVAPRIVLQIKSSETTTRDIRLEIFPGISSQFESIDITMIDKLSPLQLQWQDREYLFSRSREARGLDIDDIDDTERMNPTNSNFIKIKLHDFEGVGTGLDLRIKDSYRVAGTQNVTNRTIEALHDIAAKKHSYLAIVVEAKADVSKKLESFQKNFKKFKAHSPWWPYKDDEGNAKCSWLEMLLRSIVDSRSGGLVRYPPQNAFTDPTEAFIKLSIGIFLEHRQKRKQLLRKYETQEVDSNIDKYIQCQLEAVCLAYGPNRPDQSKFWTPTLLNHNIPNWCDTLRHLLGITEEKAVQLRRKVIQSYTWNKQQVEAIVRCTSGLHGRFGMITGASGSGRTTTIAGLACLYKAAGASVVMFAPAASAARALADRVQRLYLKVFGSPPGDDLYTLIPGDANYQKLKDGKEPDDPSAASIIVTTPRSVCHRQFFWMFEENSKAIVLLHDDAYHLLESEILATIFAFEDVSNILGVIFAMDLKEWYLNVLTQTDPYRESRLKRGGTSYYYRQFLHFFRQYHKENNRYPEDLSEFRPKGESHIVYGRNEFADQIGLSLPTRLLRQGFPETVLTKQERMPAALAEYPFQRSYQAFVPLPETSFRNPSEVPPVLETVYKWLNQEPRPCPVLFINVKKSLSYKYYGSTESRSNDNNARAVAELLSLIYRRNRNEVKEIALMTPYSDQCRLYNSRVLPKLASDLETTDSQLPKARTVDSMRGHEAKYVIYDLVVTDGDASHGLGIVMDNYLAHLASTRAKEMFLIFGSNLLFKNFPRFWKCLNQFDMQPNRPLPYIADYVEQLVWRKQAFNAPVEESYSYGYVPPEWAHKQKGVAFEGIWERSFARV